MAGQRGRSGRVRLPGRLYRMNVRFLPGRHSPELAELLEMLASAAPSRRADILNGVAAGGVAAARTAARPEVQETKTLLKDLFGWE